MAKGIRRVGEPVSVEVARDRAMSAAYCGDLMPMSAFGRVIWPDGKFNAPQGAAFAASPIVRGLVGDGFLCSDEYGYRITSAGRRAVLEGTVNGSVVRKHP